VPSVSVIQPGTAVPATPLELITSATPVTQVVLVLLAVLSLTSWTIMFAKWLEFRRIRKTGARFMRDFERVHSIVFLTETTPAMASAVDRTARLGAAQVEALREVLDSQSDAERDALARFIPWLGTIGSVSPLIGLLGTVLGIINSFLGIATRGSGNIGAVAPGVAEALTATALALAVAIPAVFAYNILATRLNGIAGELEGFGSELVALLVREGRI
jgi:biopolymer transport protein TolQ